MRVSKHAEKRMKERCGLTKKSKDRMALKVLEEGIPHSRTKGRLNKWVTSLYFKNESANNIMIYGNNAYIFCNDILITVLLVPNDIWKNMSHMVIKD